MKKEEVAVISVMIVFGVALPFFMAQYLTTCEACAMKGERFTEVWSTLCSIFLVISAVILGAVFGFIDFLKGRKWK